MVSKPQVENRINEGGGSGHESGKLSDQCHLSQADANLAYRQAQAAKGGDNALGKFGTCSISGVEPQNKDVEKAAAAINENFSAAAIKASLLDMSAADRKLLQETYKTKYGVDLNEKLEARFGGTELKELRLYLGHSDEKGSLAGGMLAIWKDELKGSGGVDKTLVENKILRQLQGLNSQDLAGLSPGLLSEVGANLSPVAKASLEIYSKGSDKVTGDDQIKLAKLAMEEGNIDRFQAVMAAATEEIRLKFATDDNRKTMESAFGNDPATLRHARDYAETGTRQADSKVLDNLHFLGDNEEQINKSLAELTEGEKASYRHGKELFIAAQEKGSAIKESWSKQDMEDYQYHEKLMSALLDATEGGRAQEEFQKYESVILSRADIPRTPEDRLLKELGKGAGNADAASIVGTLSEQFRLDPALRDKISQDPALGEKVNEALKKAMDRDDYEAYGKRMLASGHLSVDAIKKLYEGVTADNEAGIYRGMADLGRSTDQAGMVEKSRILADPAYQDKVFSNLNSEERQVALNALKQGELAPEDQLRSFVLKSQEDRDAALERINKLNAQEKDDLKRRYDTKYGDWRADLSGLSSDDGKLFSAALNSHDLGMQDNHALRTQEHAETRGSAFSHKLDKYWDGTGPEVDDKLNQVSGKVKEASASGQELSADELGRLNRQFAEAAADHIKSQGAAASAVADAAVTVAAVGLAAPSGGISLGLLAKSAAAASVIRVGTKVYLMGDNYQFAQAARDAATGMVEGATGAVGGGALAEMLRVGKGAAGEAAKATVANLGEETLKEGSQEVLEKGMKDMVADAVNKGSSNIEPDKIKQLADAVSKSTNPEEQARVAEEIRKTLDSKLTNGSHDMVEDAATKAKLEAGASAMQGISASTVYSLGQWDANKPLSENTAMMGQSVFMAGMTGGVFGGGFGRLGRGAGESAAEVEKAGVRLGRSEAELNAKIPALKNDLGINMWDLPSTQRQKLITDLQNNNRIQYHEGQNGIVIDNGNTRVHLADQLGVPHDQITVHTANGKKTLAQIEQEYLEKRKAALDEDRTITETVKPEAAADGAHVAAAGEVQVTWTTPDEKLAAWAKGSEQEIRVSASDSTGEKQAKLVGYLRDNPQRLPKLTDGAAGLEYQAGGLFGYLGKRYGVADERMPVSYQGKPMTLADAKKAYAESHGGAQSGEKKVAGQATDAAQFKPHNAEQI